MGKSNDNTISQLAILKQKINERGKIMDATAAAVKDTLNMLQSLVLMFKSCEGLLLRNFPTTIQDQELISVKENLPDKPIQVHESKHPRNHDNNYRGELNNTAEDEIVGRKNTTSITNNDCRLSKQKFNRLLQEEIRHKVETEEHKKKVKMKLQRQEHEVCLRKGEMYKAHKTFDEMTEMFLKLSFFKNYTDVEILVKKVLHKERFKESKIASVHHHEDFEDKMEEVDGICKPFMAKMYQGAGGDAGEIMDEDGPCTGTGSNFGPKIKELVQDASMYKLKAVEYKKKVKMKEIGARPSQLDLVTLQQKPHYLHALGEFQRHKLENFLRKEEMEVARKLFDEMPKKNTFQNLGSLWILCYISSQIIESSPHVAIVGLLGELVTEDGRQYSSERGMFGRVSNGSESDQLFPVPVKLSLVILVTQIMRSSSLWELLVVLIIALHLQMVAQFGAGGYNNYGQLGFSGDNSVTPRMMDQFLTLGYPDFLPDESLTNHKASIIICSVKVGGMMSLAIDDIGTLWMWGNCPQKSSSTENGLLRIDEIDEWLPITSSRNAKWWYSAFHNVTAMVGAGVLSLPYAMAQLGWDLGVVILVLSWIITLFTLWHMVEMHELKEPRKRFNRYHELGHYAFGETLGLYIMMPQQLVVEVGICIVYMVTRGQSLQKVHNLLCHKPCKAKAAAGTVFDFFSALGQVAFAYAGHNVVLEIQATIPSTPQKPSKDPMWIGVVVAYIVVALCYFSVAIIGYWMFGNSVEDNILISLEKPTWLIVMATLQASYPEFDLEDKVILMGKAMLHIKMVV